MILLHTADLHFNRRWFRWFLNDAPEHDLLVISGDILDHHGKHSLSRQIEWVTRWVRDYAKPVALCSGWQDLIWDAEDELWTPAYWLRGLAGPGVMVDGQRASLRDLSLQCIPATARTRSASADLWIVHAPPAGTGAARRRNGRDGGDHALAAAIAAHQPRWVLCGRVHDPVQWNCFVGDTLVLNPGRDPLARFPNHILLDTETGAICHVRDTLPIHTTSELGSVDAAPLPRDTAAPTPPSPVEAGER